MQVVNFLETSTHIELCLGSEIQNFLSEFCISKPVIFPTKRWCLKLIEDDVYKVVCFDIYIKL